MLWAKFATPLWMPFWCSNALLAEQNACYGQSSRHPFGCHFGAQTLCWPNRTHVMGKVRDTPLDAILVLKRFAGRTERMLWAKFATPLWMPFWCSNALLAE